MTALLLKTIPYLLAALLPWCAAAQDDCYFQLERHDLGVIGGTTFYVGDLSGTNVLFRNLSFYGGPLYRYHFNDRYAIRGQLAVGELSGTMSRPDMPPKRDTYEEWNFTRPFIFMEVVGEAGFFPMNVVDFRKNQRWSPYLLGGVGFSALSSQLEISSEQTFCGYILVGVGVKFAAWKRLTFGLEWMMRKTFSDSVDYYAGKKSSWAINKDWIGTLGLSFTYRLFESRPCAAHRQPDPLPYPLKGKRVE